MTCDRVKDDPTVEAYLGGLTDIEWTRFWSSDCREGEKLEWSDFEYLPLVAVGVKRVYDMEKW